jgi:hypothetical protein
VTISILAGAPDDRAQQAGEYQGVHRQQHIPVEQPGQPDRSKPMTAMHAAGG